jgi:hypothetical protein
MWNGIGASTWKRKIMAKVIRKRRGSTRTTAVSTVMRNMTGRNV